MAYISQLWAISFFIISNIKQTQTKPLRKTVTASILTGENTKYNYFSSFKSQ